MLRTKLDPIATVYIGLVMLCGVVYTSLELTPSSYGVVLNRIGAVEDGPVFGTPRTIREDEWACNTAFFQACVRNNFQRFNETSFYREDLRNFLMLPLKDWSLVFKPEVWAFFITSPAMALSLYYSLLMCAFLVGYFLLFRKMGIDSLVAASVALLFYFSGFAQFWWTSFHSLMGGLPWILLIFLSDLRWWIKALLFSWVIPVVVFSEVYPTYFAEFAFAGIILTAAVRPSLFRSQKDIAALAIGGLVTAVAGYIYYHDAIQVMQNTWYPAKRVGEPGTTPVPVVLSQFFPYLTFVLRSYIPLAKMNICESGTIGSFFPLLTLCLISPRSLRSSRALRDGLSAIFAAIALIVVWQLTPAPRWIGHILLWDHGNAERLLFISGFLLTAGCLLIWRYKAMSPSRFQIALFVAAGPLFSLVLKAGIFHVPWELLRFDIELSALALVAGVIACLSAVSVRLPLLLVTITLMNVLAFGEFNPLQSAEPIFDVPQTLVVEQLRNAQESTPGKFLLEMQFSGAVLNGMGFRSVNHLLLAPSLAIFRKYFPTMDAHQFDFVFNRYAYLLLRPEPLPRMVRPWEIHVPIEAFEPPRNVRAVILDDGSRKDCSVLRAGQIERVKADGDRLTIEGWAPWKSESSTQELHVISPRSLRAGPLLTVTRPDISETMADYNYNRSGFQLELTSADGRPIRAEEIVIEARDTAQGRVELTGCGCP